MTAVWQIVLYSVEWPAMLEQLVHVGCYAFATNSCNSTRADNYMYNCTLLSILENRVHSHVKLFLLSINFQGILSCLAENNAYSCTTCSDRH